MSQPVHVRATAPFRWEGIPVLEYKEDGGTHFKAITRQKLFEEPERLGTELRYFEVSPGGHSTLEKHDHVHAVMVIRGGGEVLIGSKIENLNTHDLVYIPSGTWHQFHAHAAEPLGFLCLVRCDRDKPHRPTEDDLKQLRTVAAVADFIRV